VTVVPSCPFTVKVPVPLTDPAVTDSTVPAAAGACDGREPGQFGYPTPIRISWHPQSKFL